MLDFNVDSRILITAILGVSTAVLLTNMSRILGHAKTRYYHHKEAIHLSAKSEFSQIQPQTPLTLPSLVKSILPPCRLNPLLFNGHLQTIYTVIKPPTAYPVHYRRRIFEQSNPMYPGTFCADFVVPSFPDSQADSDLPPRTAFFSEEEWSTLPSDDDTPMIVALHGLSGGSYELYLRAVLHPLINSQKPWAAVVINSRGCANHKITTPILFNARATWDLCQFIKNLKELFPNRPLYAVGFSLGANILTNYIGEEGSNCVFRAAVALSCPWNLDVSNLSLQRTWFGREVYSRAMGGNLLKLFDIHQKQVLENPKIDEAQVRRVKYLHEFDRAIQCPSWGYPTEQAYYRDASSADSVLAVRIPFLGISAEDDPIVCEEAIPKLEFEQNPWTTLATTSLGGHLSWFEIGGSRWMAKATTAFFRAMQDVEPDHATLQKLKTSTSEGGASTGPKKPVFEPMRRKMGSANEMTG